VTLAKHDVSMSDDQQNSEWESQHRRFDAMRLLDAVIIFVNGCSVLEKIDATAWENFKHDEMPRMEIWDQKIAEARNP
jgi:hypothetical protein